MEEYGQKDRLKNIFGQQLRLFRHLRGHTQRSISEKTHLSEEYIRKLESGRASPSFNAIANLSKALETEPANFFLPIDSPPHPEYEYSEELLPSGDLIWNMVESGVWSADKLSQKIEWSESLYHMLGYQSLCLTPSMANFLQHIPENQQEQFSSAYQKLIDEEEPFSSILNVQRCDGAQRYWLCQMSTNICLENIGPILGTFWDITEHQKIIKLIHTNYFRLQDQFKHYLKETHLEYAGADQKSCSILVAEDDDLNQYFLQKLLQKAGNKVVCVADGTEALQRLYEENFDLIIMDIQMPNMNGVKATQEIRQSKASFSNIPIIALTGHAMKGQKEKILQAGLDDYLAKPVSKEDVLQMVQKYTDGKNKYSPY